MAKLPPLRNNSLTSDVSASDTDQQISPFKESAQTLPPLKQHLEKQLSLKPGRRPLALAPRPRPSFEPVFLVPGTGPDRDEVYVNGLPIRHYLIGGEIYAMQQPERETTSQTSRLTLDGRQITYLLHIEQQPYQARACGAGTKCELFSSPPPR
jgi:hypothetical protein